MTSNHDTSADESSEQTSVGNLTSSRTFEDQMACYGDRFDQIWEEVMRATPQEVAAILASLEGRRGPIRGREWAPSRGVLLLRRAAAVVGGAIAAGDRGLRSLMVRILQSSEGSFGSWARPAIVSVIVLLIGFGLGSRLGGNDDDAAIPGSDRGGAPTIARWSSPRQQIRLRQASARSPDVVAPDMTVMAPSLRISSTPTFYRVASDVLLVAGPTGAAFDSGEGPGPGELDRAAGNSREGVARPKSLLPPAWAQTYSPILTIAINCSHRLPNGDCILPQEPIPSATQPIELDQPLVTRIRTWYAQSAAYGSEVVCVIAPDRPTVECRQPLQAMPLQLDFQAMRLASTNDDWLRLLTMLRPINP